MILTRSRVALVLAFPAIATTALVIGTVSLIRYLRVIRTEAALGAKDQLDPAPCEILSGDSIELEKWADGATIYRAVRAGRTEVSCADDMRHSVEVRPATSLTLAGKPKFAIGERATIASVARDSWGRSLELGRYAQLEWDVAGSLKRDDPGSCEFPPWCGDAPAGAAWILARTSGAGIVRVRFQELEAMTTVEVPATP